MKKILNNLKIRNPETGKFESVPGVIGEYPGITYPKPNISDQWQDSTTGEEQFTGDYWIDGKPIYRRVGEGYIGATNADVQFQHIPDVDMVVKLYGCAIADTGERIPLNMYINDTFKFNVFVKKYGENNTHLVAQTKTAGKVYAIVEFTKPD